ncbi:MAG: M56 family metallopeptidase [Acidobacteria bacterium]|nr:M56 family metallopeptidase [Acidobacteriota bacterium]
MMNPISWESEALFVFAIRSALELLVWSWQALALLALAWLALKICRMKSPALRHQVWLFGLVVVAALPLSSMAVRRFPSLKPASPVLKYVAEAPQVVIDLAPQAPAQTLPEATPDKATTTSPVKATVKTSVFPHSLFAALFAALFTAWMIGALIMLARLMKNHLGVRRTLKRAQSIRPADLDCDESGILRIGKVSLRLSTEIHSPILFGVFRPTILLPADITSWTTPAERAAMIQHELAHVERRDTIVNLFQTALSVIFFFHPLVRYACRQLSLEREMACDDRVVALGASAEVYAAGILKAAERSIIAFGLPSGAHQLALFSAKQILERRIEMILNTNRARTIAHQWRYLVLPIALIAVAGFLLIPRYSAKNSSTNSSAKDSLKPAKGSPVKAIYSPQEQELIDMVQQVAAVTPQLWHYRGEGAGLPDERLTFGAFKVYDGPGSLTIVRPKPPQLANRFIPVKVEVRDFEVSIDGDSAVIDFIGTLHLSNPGENEETLLTDRYRVKMMKVNDQWQADKQYKGSGAMFWPPNPPSPPFEPQGAHFKRTKHIGAMSLHNFGNSQFVVQSSLPFEGPQSVEMQLSEMEMKWCGCKAWELQNAVVKLDALELRAEKGNRALGPFIDAVHLKDRFEFQWRERIYYGLGDITAGYHLQNKRLGLGSSPETRLYRTPDRTGEAITLQQLAQELKDQALRKN